jgi:hypothetical protein
MLPYQFNEIYFRVTGEYENDIQILFFNSDASDVMVYNCGSFYLVNKPAQLCLEGYKNYDYKLNRKFEILHIAENYQIDEIYIQLELSIIKIAWYFSTADGQQVRDFWIYTMKEHPQYYNQELGKIKSAVEVIPTDLRFVLPRRS